MEPKTYPNQRQILALHGYQPLLEVKCQNGNKIVEYLSNDEFIKQLINYQNQIQLLAEAVEKGDSVAFNNLCVLPNNDIFNCCLSWEGRVVGDYLPLLHRAVLFNHPHLVKAILMLKSPHQSIDTLFDQHNRTALHYAYAIPEADEIRKLLLNSGCSEHVLDKNGKEPLDFSDKACTKTMNKLLKRLKNKEYKLSEPDPWQSNDEQCSTEYTSEHRNDICDASFQNCHNCDLQCENELELENHTKYCNIL